MKIAILIMVLLLTHQVKSQTTIGWDASCNYDMNADANGLQQAIDDGMTELRLTNEDSFMVNLDIGAGIIIKGGYNNCVDAVADTQSATNSILDGSNNVQPVIKIGFLTDISIELSYLTITNGTGMSLGGELNYSGGLSIRDVLGNISLNHVSIESNNGYKGGGLSVYNGSTVNPTVLIMDISDTIIQQNSSINKGGGLSCHQLDDNTKIVVNLKQGSSIRNNHAGVDGGGIINNRCEINFYAGVSSQTVNTPEFELYNNTANNSGAGIWSQAGTTNFIGSYTQPVNIVENQANLDSNANGAGGGVHMTSNRAIANLTNTYVTGNSTGKYGAGLYAFQSIINMTTANSGCSYDRYCSKINENILENLSSGGGAAMATRFSGKINVKQTLIENNNADQFGYVAFVTDNGEIVLEGNLIKNNGNDNTYSNNSGLLSKNGGIITVSYNTVLGNVERVFQIGLTGIVSLYGNIINETGNILHTQNSSVVTFNCNMINDTSTIAVPMTDTIEAVAIFIDEANNDYRLSASSIQAIDVCDNAIYSPGRDLGNKFRGLDNPNVIDVNGFYDLGAYEHDDGDLIYKDSFE